MQERIKIIDDYNQLLFEIYQQENLLALSDNHYSYKDIPVLAISNPAVVLSVKTGLHDYLNEVLHQLNIPNSDKNFSYSESELCTITADIKYRIGTLYIYHPYIVKLAESYGFHKGKKHFFYEQTLADARFNREIPVVFESIYKFWQRISDYLSCFFPEVILKVKGRTFFHHPFEHIGSKYPQLLPSEHLQWLLQFSTEEYPVFNKRRSFFVHSRGYDNEFFGKFLDRARDEEHSMLAMDKERDDLLDFLKHQLLNCLEGYAHLMRFLNEMDIQKIGEGGFSYKLFQQQKNVSPI